ncbi:response regulator [Azospirillum sp. A29]|uniref:response regulator n=1 Tax=Azospirillum sp. A29 TaxID=3160606 RepID=UPI0036700D6D
MSMLRVLVVEDEFLIQDAVVMIIEEVPGCHVVGAVDSADAALELISRAPVDLAVLDIKLPGTMDGVDLAHELRRRHGVPVVFLSGSGDPTTMRRIEAFGPLAFLRKPFHPQELKRLIANRKATDMSSVPV